MKLQLIILSFLLVAFFQPIQAQIKPRLNRATYENIDNYLKLSPKKRLNYYKHNFQKANALFIEIVMADLAGITQVHPKVDFFDISDIDQKIINVDARQFKVICKKWDQTIYYYKKNGAMDSTSVNLHPDLLTNGITTDGSFLYSYFAHTPQKRILFLEAYYMKIDVFFLHYIQTDVDALAGCHTEDFAKDGTIDFVKFNKAITLWHKLLDKKE